MTDERTIVSGLAHGAADALDEIAALRRTIEDRYNQLAGVLDHDPGDSSWELMVEHVAELRRYARSLELLILAAPKPPVASEFLPGTLVWPDR